MLTFLSIAFLIYGAMHFYALGKVWLAFPHMSAVTLLLVLWGIVMTFSPLFLWQLAKLNWHNVTVVASWVVYIWMGLLFLFCSIFLMYDLGHALITLMGIKWPVRELAALLTVSLLALSMLGYGLVEAGQIQVEKINISTPKLAPSIGRLTIAQISDLHLGVMLGGKFLDRVITRLRELKPDIVVATGDIVDGQGDDLNELARHFLAYKPPKGAYAVIGNHEVYAGSENSLRFLRNAGFTVLRGGSAAAGGIILAGVDDPSAGTYGQQAERAPANADDYVVLLKHRPVVDKQIPFDLQLSGHIHGGQIFPFGLLTRLVYGVGTGLTRLGDGRLLYVSRGTGTWGPPIRLLAEPEITLITLESEKIK
ncbi:MAG TPA: metallophosphoesterase [Gallionella sp.]|nr:metallophosphoesterase [Gallionella sp.]